MIGWPLSRYLMSAINTIIWWISVIFDSINNNYFKSILIVSPISYIYKNFMNNIALLVPALFFISMDMKILINHLNSTWVIGIKSFPGIIFIACVAPAHSGYNTMPIAVVI